MTDLREQLENDPPWLRRDRDSWKTLAHASRERAERAEREVERYRWALTRINARCRIDTPTPTAASAFAYFESRRALDGKERA